MRIETLNRYNDPGRYYHTLEHINRMFEIAYIYSLNLTKAQKIAIYHHDSVYVIGAKDNESRSAEIMRLEESLFYCSKTVDTAYKIILSTARHEPLCEAAKDVIDLDLWGLSASQEEYKSYTYAVYREHAPFLKFSEWEAGRGSWLESMLSRKQIYHGFLKGSDENARNNMRRELKKLTR